MINTIKPQPGPQERFLSCGADIVIYGGAAGGGKTFAELLEPLYHIHNPRFGAVIFRRNLTQVTNEGGLWDTAKDLYGHFGAKFRQAPKFQCTFPSGAKVTFAHLQQESDVKNWQGSQIPLVCYDELTHFTEYQFTYLMTRMRSTCGVRPYLRATTNPEAGSWVCKYIDWYIDWTTGYAIPERSGVIRYLAVYKNQLYWGETPEECVQNCPDEANMQVEEVKSFAFIHATLQDNKILLEKDPAYYSNLKNNTEVEKERLLFGNWKIKPEKGLYYKRPYFSEITREEAVRINHVKWVRGWDLAASDAKDNPKGDYTASGLLSKDTEGNVYIWDATMDQLSPAGVRSLVARKANQDGVKTTIRMSQDPGQAGKDQIVSYRALLAGYAVKARTMSGSKIDRAGPMSTYAESGKIFIVTSGETSEARKWVEMFYNQAESFPPDKGSPDLMDAFHEAFFEITLGSMHEIDFISAPKSVEGDPDYYGTAQYENSTRKRGKGRDKNEVLNYSELISSSSTAPPSEDAEEIADYDSDRHAIASRDGAVPVELLDFDDFTSSACDGAELVGLEVI